MHQTSELYKSIASGPHYVELEATVNGATFSFSQLEAVSTVAELFGREVPAVGNAIARQFDLSILTPSAPLPIGAKCSIRGRVRSGDLVSEWIPKGEFYIDTRKRNKLRDGGDTTTDIFGYDALVKGNVDYPDSTGWPKTDAAVVSAAAAFLGVSVACSLTRGYIIDKPEEMTVSEVLGYIAAMYGGNFYIDDNGALNLCQLGNGTGVDISPASLSVGEALPGISRVVLHKMDGTQFVSGSDTGRTINIDCPWATQAMANNLLQQLRGYAYQPFSVVDTAVDLALEIGDTVNVGGITERIYSMEQTLGTVTLAAISAPDVKELDHSYYPNKNSLGGAVGAAIGNLSNQTNGLRIKQEQLVADIGDVSSGLFAIASAQDIEKWKQAKTTLFAVISDDISSLGADLTLYAGKTEQLEKAEASLSTRVDGAEASLTLKAEKSVVDGHTTSIATLNAKVVKLDAYTIMADGFMFVDKLSGRIIRAQQINVPIGASGDRVFTPEQITFYGSINSSPARYDRYFLTTGGGKTYLDSGSVTTASKFYDKTGSIEYDITYPGGGSGGDPITRTVLTSQGSAQSPMSVSEEDN